MAIGASRGRLVRQLFSETLLLAVMGAAAGVLLARWLSRVLLLLIKTDARGPSLDLAMDWRLLAFATGLATLTAIVFGLAPALTSTRTSPISMMSAGARSTAGRDRFLLRRFLVVSQVALSLVLLFGALLFVRSLTNILTVDPGMRKDGVLVGFCSWSRVTVPPDQRIAFENRILEHLRAVPGVRGAAAVAVVPLVGWGWNNHMWMEGQPQRTDESAVSWLNRVTPGYFQMMGMPLLSGRDFDANRDTNSSPKVAIVNQSFALKFAGTPNPIGKRVWIEPVPGEKEKLLEIIGVVADTNYRDVRETTHMPIVFLPEMQNTKPGKFSALMVRTSLPTEIVMASMRKTLADVSPDIVTNWTQLDTMIRNGTIQERLLAQLSAFFGLLAGLLAVVGLYGVMSYIVARRTSEIGVRMALGAARRDVLMLVLREALSLLATGIVVGAVLALLAARAATAMLFGLKPHDPLTLVVAALALGIASIAASYLPARRASRLDPVVALRLE
jgi:predicted permease